MPNKPQINNIDLDNPEFQHAWDLIQHTHRSVFLTGKAGTGKSTFLKYICQNTEKKFVVLAPTGIAAVNVGGQTLHSFFKIPFKPILPTDPDFIPRQIRKTLRYPKDKVKLIRELELIVIDEISMVRADIIDFVDNVLRIYSGNMREPFGGKQLLFVGDIFQLEPVATTDTRDILRRCYNQFFFFNAHVFSSLGLVPIELQKIYRQTDNAFISLLDRVRINKATQADIKLLNSRYNAAYCGSNDSFTMTLATRRDTVDSINSLVGGVRLLVLTFTAADSYLCEAVEARHTVGCNLHNTVYYKPVSLIDNDCHLFLHRVLAGIVVTVAVVAIPERHEFPSGVAYVDVVVPIDGGSP